MRKQKLVSLTLFVVQTLYFAPSLFANQEHNHGPSSHNGVSHARIVSLSVVEGTVLERRPGTPKWELATLDAPVQEGWSVATGRDSHAEVQFENGSTLRIGELSRVDFTKMALAPHKGRVSHMILAFGLATLHVIPRRHDEFVLQASAATLVPRGGSEFRTDLDHGRVRVEVFHGSVRMADASVTDKFGKSQVVVCDYSVPSGAIQIAGPVRMDDWDRWVKSRDDLATLEAYEDVRDPMDGWAEELNPMGSIIGASLYGGDNNF